MLAIRLTALGLFCLVVTVAVLEARHYHHKTDYRPATFEQRWPRDRVIKPLPRTMMADQTNSNLAMTCHTTCYWLGDTQYCDTTCD